MEDDYKPQPHKPVTQMSSASGLTKLIAGIVMVLLLAGGGFATGMQYQKSHDSARPAAGRLNQGFSRGGFGQQRNGSIGSVTAVSASSISVQNDRTNSTKTYTLNSSTTVTNNGSAASVSDIKLGDTVLVTTNSASSTTATRIVLNPSFGGPGGVDQQSTSSGTDSSNTITN